jgi:hypothetical protein
VSQCVHFSKATHKQRMRHFDFDKIYFHTNCLTSKQNASPSIAALCLVAADGHALLVVLGGLPTEERSQIQVQRVP